MAQIKVNDLTFCYEGSYDNVFEHVNLQIDSDWRCGLIGRNGKGKTTFLKLLTGAYEYSGSITGAMECVYFPYTLSGEARPSRRDMHYGVLEEGTLLGDEYLREEIRNLENVPVWTTMDLLEELSPGYELWRVCRELEQLSYTFAVSDLSLAGLTHLVRHRMQSIIVPPIERVDHSRYILPDTVWNNEPARERYETALVDALEQVRTMAADPVLGKYLYYYAVAGNLVDVMTTLNARELELLMRLRTCNRAQWEIREIATDMLRLLRESFPALFNRFGPSCYRAGACPEGRMTCGQSEAVRARFSGRL